MSRLPDRFGFYLGLTGARIRAGDMRASGIATHHVPAERLDALTEALAASADTDAVLDRFAEPVAPQVLDEHRAAIAGLFAPGSLSDIVARLEADAGSDEFAAATLKALRAKSPTSLAVALRQIGEGAALSMDQCMAMEYRIVSRMLTGHDFFEGIRAAIVDKGDTPHWRPAAIADLDAVGIDRYFAPVESGELVL
ncbi:MAG: enoyl-CoA hydratase/isomerase family protein [Brucellaceae bacterium]|nr:enoyl-CoA hydratase/isomerase family protein [Brucellaceae bacterium]